MEHEHQSRRLLEGTIFPCTESLRHRNQPHSWVYRAGEWWLQRKNKSVYAVISLRVNVCFLWTIFSFVLFIAFHSKYTFHNSSHSVCLNWILNGILRVYKAFFEDIRLILILSTVCNTKDHLCGLVVRVLGYRSRGPGSIPGATRLSEE
jgi:hypothetical protein